MLILALPGSAAVTLLQQAVADDIQRVWATLAAVSDPEIPVISIVDLGIVRDVAWDGQQQPPGFVVTVTPTYSGCPATEVIARSIHDALHEAGFGDVAVRTQLSPAWTTDWLSAQGRDRLRAYGIAPPVGRSDEQVIDISRLVRRGAAPVAIACPRCGSNSTQRLSEFGSTPCKALYRCEACREPFDYFKCH